MLDCKCKCKWTDFTKTISCEYRECIIINNIIGRVGYGVCPNNEKVGSIDSCLVNDYNWYKEIYNAIDKKVQSSGKKLDMNDSK